MKNKLTYSYLFLLLLLFFAAELIVNPTGEFPLNDDWSYAKSVLDWQRFGHYSIGEWPAMTLLTHLLWGTLFTKVFGFSFLVLRMSVLFLSLLGTSMLFFLVNRLSGQPKIALLSCLVLLFNPIYFNLSNTYMTDVTFNTILIGCCFFAYNFYLRKSPLSFFTFFVLAGLLVFTRQFGVVVPVTFSLGCLFLRDKKAVFFLASLVLTALIIFLLKYYESFLHQILPTQAAYKYSGDLSPLSSRFWDNLFSKFLRRHSTILLHVFIYTLPLSIAFLPRLVSGIKGWPLVVIGIGTILFTHVIFYAEPFPMGNVFQNLNLGTETFYDYLSHSSKRPVEHTFSQDFEDAMFWVKYICIALSLFCMSLAGIKLYRKKNIGWLLDPFRIFLVSFMFIYSVILLVTESYFDRYHLPLITVGILLLAYFERLVSAKWWPTLVVMLPLLYVSVFGTKDYFVLNKNRWEAYHFLKNEKKVHYSKINGGFEVTCWNEAEYCWWYLFLDLKGYDYLIQYWQEPGFKPYKEYEFQRYFPYKKDKIYIFVRDSTVAASR